MQARSAVHLSQHPGIQFNFLCRQQIFQFFIGLAVFDFRLQFIAQITGLVHGCFPFFYSGTRPNDKRFLFE